MQPDAYGRLITALTRPSPPPPQGDGHGPGAAESTPERSDGGNGDGTSPDASAVAAQPAPRPARPEGDHSEPATPSVRPAHGAPAAATTDADDIPVNPPQMQISDAEVAALARMGALIGTPRTAKRLVNLYRLIRAGLSEAEVEDLVERNQFRPLAIVLAAQVGYPQASTAFLAELVGTNAGARTITQRLTALRSHDGAGDHPDDANWGSLKAALRAACLRADGSPDPAFDVRVADLRPWIPRLRRYSFEGALAGSGGGDAVPSR
jgi:hypothetical protein